MIARYQRSTFINLHLPSSWYQKVNLPLSNNIFLTDNADLETEI